MPAEPLALSTVPPEPPAEVHTDYDAICSAVAATARGRWFLDEYAKRNRSSDTLQVLAAIARMEAAVVGDREQQASQHAHQEVRIELLEMARAIAQTRAEVAESRPGPSQHLASEPASAAAPDVVAAAERLRQIAWTMRACGVEVVASDQIGQIADTILSADALRSLGDQRAHKLTEALHYLEHRIDRMLDSRLAAANGVDAEPVAEAAPPQTNGHDRDVPLATAAVAMIAAAMRGDVAETAETETEPAPSPAMAEAAATAISQDAALAAPDAAEFPLDDDVVLTVADSPVGQGPDPARAVVVALEREPTIARVEPAPIAENIEPELAAPTDVDAQALRLEPAELELEPLVPAMPPAAEDNAKAGFAGFELEPLVVATAAEPQAELHPAAIEEPSDEPAVVAASAIDDVAEEPLVEAPPATSAATEPVPETDAAADDDLPLAQATDAMATGFPDQEPVAAPETAATTAIAEPADAPPPAAAEADPVALQVEHDLDVLTDFVPDDIVQDNTRDVAAAPPAEPVREDLVHDDDPAAFLLDAPLQNVPPAADVGAQVADTEASRAQISDALTAIETELFAGTTPSAARAHPPAAMAMSPAAARPTLPPIVDGPLAALMAMSEEERIALFS